MHSPSLWSHGKEPRAALAPIWLMWLTEAHRGTATVRNKNQDPGFLALSPQPVAQVAWAGVGLGNDVRGQHPPCPPYSAGQVVAPSCPRDSDSESSSAAVFLWLPGGLLAVPKTDVQTVPFRPPPTPAPPAPASLPRGLWMLLQEKEPPLIHRSIFTPSFSRSVHPPPQSLGQGSKLPLQHPLGPWPCAQNSRGVSSSQGQEAERERAAHLQGPLIWGEAL